MTDDELPDLTQRAINIVRIAINEARPRLIEAALTAEAGERGNTRHADNFLSTHDLWMHERYAQLIEQELTTFVYASEEADPRVIGPDPNPDLCVLVDPLDTSELAVRGLHGYTHLIIYSRHLERPVAAVVGDIFHQWLYAAGRTIDGTDRAWIITDDNRRHRLETRTQRSLSTALVTNYLMRPAERFHPLTQQHALLEALGRPDNSGKSWGRIGVDFGSVGLCHVAAGFTDAMIEFAKGFAIWDLAPGHYILTSAGGTVTDLNGTPLTLDYRLKTLTNINAAMTGRQKFVAAASGALAQEIAALRS